MSGKHHGPIPGMRLFESLGGVKMIETKAILTCPYCKTTYTLEMPTSFCQIMFSCKYCGENLTPREGECCVFCSYADKKCPPKQNGAVCRT